jgi:hypothetical protein
MTPQSKEVQETRKKKDLMCVSCLVRADISSSLEKGSMRLRCLHVQGAGNPDKRKDDLPEDHAACALSLRLRSRQNQTDMSMW